MLLLPSLNEAKDIYDLRIYSACSRGKRLHICIWGGDTHPNSTSACRHLILQADAGSAPLHAPACPPQRTSLISRSVRLASTAFSSALLIFLMATF